MIVAFGVGAIGCCAGIEYWLAPELGAATETIGCCAGIEYWLAPELGAAALIGTSVEYWFDKDETKVDEFGKLVEYWFDKELTRVEVVAPEFFVSRLCPKVCCRFEDVQ